MPSSRLSAPFSPLSRLRFLMGCAVALAALVGAPGCSNSASPTLPIPPPAALSSTPDAEGMVTIRGSSAIEGALASAYNERLVTGTIGEVDDLGEFTLRLPAGVGDPISVWQTVGPDRSEILTIRVPGP